MTYHVYECDVAIRSRNAQAEPSASPRVGPPVTIHCQCAKLRACELRLAREWVQERSCSDAWMTARQAALAFDAMERELLGAGCTWAHGDCPNGLACRECKRMDDLIDERERGHRDGWSEALTRVVEVVEGLPCKCNDSLDYCDGQTDAISAIEKLAGAEE